MSLRMPVKVIVASPEPSPTMNARPVVPLKLSNPLVAVSVTRTGSGSASASEIQIALPSVEENTRSLSSSIVCDTGAELAGGSLTAVTLMLTVSVSPNAPPEPVLPKSFVTI